MYKIYMLSFPNGKKYIGCTKTKLNYRTGYNGSHYAAKNIKNAISEFGWENVEKNILKENLSYEEAKFYEKFYINKYKTLNAHYGYNKMIGGGFSKEIKAYPHIMTNAKINWINSLKGKPLSESHKNNIRDAHIKRLDYFVVQYDLNGNLLNKWSSACEAQRKLGIKKQMICNCCFLNEKKPQVVHTSHGYIWKKEKKS